MDRRIVALYADYTEGTVNRREFLKKLASLAGGAAAAWAILPLLENGQANAAKVPADDSRLESHYQNYTGVSGDVKAYWASPKGNPKLPGVVVIHENKGLHPHIEDVARRIALEGFTAMAPDALSPLGGTPPDTAAAVKMIHELDMEKTTADFLAAVKYLDTHPGCTGKVGVVGFCWGGAMANQMAVRSPELDAAVPYYGRQPAVADVPKIKAALLLHYGGEDQRINQGITAFEAALKKAGVAYEIHIYEGAKHAFNNDTNPERYHPEAANLAWQRTMAFFKDRLK